MKILISENIDLAKIVEPSFDKGSYFFDKDIYLSKVILDSLQEKGVLDNLENMDFIICSSQKRWEISGKPPTDLTGAVASVLPRVVEGYFTENGTKVVCDLDT